MSFGDQDSVDQDGWEAQHSSRQTWTALHTANQPGGKLAGIFTYRYNSPQPTSSATADLLCSREIFLRQAQIISIAGGETLVGL